MPLQAKVLAKVLNEDLTLHSSLCRRELAAYTQAIKGNDQVVVACTQESHLFNQIGAGTEGAVAPVKFVNIRETGGWSRQASQAMPKIAALLAAAHLPEPEPVPTVSYKSSGRLLIIGPLAQAERAANFVSDVLDVTVFTQGGVGAQERRYPVLGGHIDSLRGWLGAFELCWTISNPIDLDLCTRCNACVAACPESAVGLDYQIDLARCTAHRACVKACGAAGAIDFERPSQALTESFDLVLDLSPLPILRQHAPPQGYLHWDGQDPAVLLKLRELVGEFEKPKFFNYKQKLCAHSRNQIVGCNACVEVCSAQAISSEHARQQIKVNPNLCIGCGACTTVCPSGALSFAYPPAADQGLKFKTLLATYRSAGGAAPVLLLHSQNSGRTLLEELGRAAQLGAAEGVPANVLPVPLWHTASLGLESWLCAIAYGASAVAVVTTQEEAPQYQRALQQQIEVAQAILHGLGYHGTHFTLLQTTGLTELDQQLQKVAANLPAVAPRPAGFALAGDKRSTLELALDHFIEQAPAQATTIELGATAPLGAVEVNQDKCTLCLSCVSACPAGALQDNALLPQLRFIEKNCVQCGLCVKTCPEQALTLKPRLLLGPERKQARVLNESQPYCCVRCGKPFGTFKAIEAMMAQLAGHAMFQGYALERLKMCSDCRVIDIYSATDETKITDL